MNQWLKSCSCSLAAFAAAVCWRTAAANDQSGAAPRGASGVIGSIQGKGSSVTISPDGDYSLTAPGISGVVIRSDVEADVDSRVLRSSAYPRHTAVQSDFRNDFGAGSTLTVTHTGLAGTPDLVCTLRLFRDQSWGEIEVNVVNTTNRAISVSSIRALHATAGPVISWDNSKIRLKSE